MCICCGLNFSLFLKFFKPVQFVFSLCSVHYHNLRQGNKNQIGLKIFEPKEILNHNIYINLTTEP